MKTLYAAYGANTNFLDMARRCPDAKYLGKGILPDYKLTFRTVADVVPDEGNSIEVGLWEITEDCESSLDFFEGFPYMYRKTSVPVSYQGETMLALIYYFVLTDELTGEIAGEARPHEGYANCLANGYADCKINSQQLLRAIAAIPLQTVKEYAAHPKKNYPKNPDRKKSIYYPRRRTRITYGKNGQRQAPALETYPT